MIQFVNVGTKYSQSVGEKWTAAKLLFTFIFLLKAALQKVHIKIV